MNIAGFQKSSFVDFPGIISCVVFTPGCNMKCGYCHNKHILGGDAPKVDALMVMDYLNKRKGMLKGVVVSGGEPTLQPDLEAFVASVKALGYMVKLDTNGTNPEVVKSLCEKGYIDYVAMDIKANIEKYSLEEIEENMNGDWYIRADEALKHKVCHKIIDSIEELM